MIRMMMWMVIRMIMVMLTMMIIVINVVIVTNIVIHDHKLSSLNSKIHQMKTIYHHHHYQYHYHHHHHLHLLFFTGKLPTVAEYNKYAVEINKTAADTFRYLNFDKLPDFVATSKDVDLGKL